MRGARSPRRAVPALQLRDAPHPRAVPRLRAAGGACAAAHQLQRRAPRAGGRTASLQCMTLVLALLLAAAPSTIYVRAGRLFDGTGDAARREDRKSTRLNSSHSQISYAVFCLKKKKQNTH